MALIALLPADGLVAERLREEENPLAQWAPKKAQRQTRKRLHAWGKVGTHTGKLGSRQLASHPRFQVHWCQTLSHAMPTQFPTFYMVERPSFWEGMARVLDFGTTLRVHYDVGSAAEADAQALLSDWLAVGNDLRSAISEYGEPESRVGR